jgi:hypothetical protein
MSDRTIPLLEALQQRIKNVCQEIRVKTGIFDRVLISGRQKAERCVAMNGNHKEHLLKSSHEHRLISGGIGFRTYVD